MSQKIDKQLIKSLSNLNLYFIEKELILNNDYLLRTTRLKENGNWHPNLKFELFKKDYSGNKVLLYFSIKESPSGCGSAAIYSYHITDNYIEFYQEIKVVINSILNSYKLNGCGLIYTTIGQNYFNNNIYNFLLDIEFKVSLEYPNHRHGLNYKQRLLTKEL